MALATYGDLKTSVANWLGRADLTSLIPDFCTLAHKQLMRDLRGHPRLQIRNAAFSISAEYVACPATFVELVSMYLNTTPKRAIKYLDNDGQSVYFGESTGIPAYVTVVGPTTSGTGDATGSNEYFRFGPVPGSTYTATMEYISALPMFTADTSTGSANWILTDNPDLYLYGALVQASAYVKDDQRIGLWLQGYKTALGDVMHAGKSTRWGANGMAVRVA